MDEQNGTPERPAGAANTPRFPEPEASAEPESRDGGEAGTDARYTGDAAAADAALDRERPMQRLGTAGTGHGTGEAPGAAAAGGFGRGTGERMGAGSGADTPETEPFEAEAGAAGRTAAGALGDASRAGARARSQGAGFREAAEDRITDGMRRAAGRAEEAADRLDDLGARADEQGWAGGRASEAAHETADLIDGLARYLRDNDAQALRAALEHQVRARPIPMLLLGVAAGWLTGKLLR